MNAFDIMRSFVGSSFGPLHYKCTQHPCVLSQHQDLNSRRQLEAAVANKQPWSIICFQGAKRLEEQLFCAAVDDGR